MRQASVALVDPSDLYRSFGIFLISQAVACAVALAVVDFPPPLRTTAVVLTALASAVGLLLLIESQFLARSNPHSRLETQKRPRRARSNRHMTRSGGKATA